MDSRQYGQSDRSYYEPLSSSQQEIRLLWLLSPERDDPDADIHVELTTVSLEQKIAYKALSYTWGNPDEPVCHVRLNGQPFEVRPNLHDCLMHLRKRGIGSKESGMPLWIDAVCINQADTSEKNSQVLMMGDLYRSATAVISWLGSDERLVKGLTMVKEIVRQWTRFRNYLEAAPEAEADVNQDQDLLPGWLLETHDLWHDEGKLDGLVRVFLSDYWRRVWVVQELILANPESHIYICGPASITESDLDALSDCVLTVFGGEVVEGLDIRVWTTVKMGIFGELTVRNELSRIQSGFVTPRLMFILHVSSTRASTDPRDVVYGLLHLIPDHGIVPDYHKPVRDVYAEWAVKAMLESRDLELLSYAGTGVGLWDDSELSLPSWIPDIRNYKGYRYVDWLKKDPRNPTTNPREGFSIHVVDDHVLKVEGRRCGTVKKISQLPSFANEHGRWEWGMVRFCLDYLIDQGGRPYPTGIPPLQALVRLVMQPKIDALRPDGDARGLHELVCGFIAWIIFSFNNIVSLGGGPSGEPLEVAASILGLSWGEDFPATYQEAVFPGVDVQELLGWSSMTDAFRDVREKAIIDYVINWCDKTRLIETEEGYLGCGPNNTEPGDQVFAITHCNTLLAFRDSESIPGSVVLLGKCDILGLKAGEIVGQVERRESSESCELLIV